MVRWDFMPLPLVPVNGLERQKIEAAQPFDGADLWFVPVFHEGNQSYPLEEIERVASLVEDLVREGSGWIDRVGIRRSPSSWLAITTK